MYSLSVGDDVYIEAYNLPLEGYTEDEIERELPAVVRTKLSRTVAATMKVEAPIELFCADADSMPQPPRETDSLGPQHCLLPLLCLYTRHSVFFLQLAFQCPFDKNGVVTGEVLSITEPLERHLESGSSSTIVRVRPAPQRRMGYATMCPTGSVAMLTHDPDVNEYALVLYHGAHQSRPKGWISTPLMFGLERLDDDEENIITDFCFAQSNGQALLATISVHLLEASGHVLGASPILFDGAVVPRSVIRESKEYLEYVSQNNANEARMRQCVAALQFFRDAFGPNDKSSYVTARTTSVGGFIQSSLFWPVQVQGPVVVSSNMGPGEEWNRALMIEPFFARDLVGMAIGREVIAVDFAIVPPTSLLPRFTYMEARDQDAVNNVLQDLGIIVERVIVDSGESGEERQDSGFTSLVRDPIVDNMIHYASSRGVVSIITNAMRVYSNQIRGKALGSDATDFLSPSGSRKDETVRSMAWSSLDVSAGDGRISLSGAVVSGDALLGHTLVATLSNGESLLCIHYLALGKWISLILSCFILFQDLLLPSTSPNLVTCMNMNRCFMWKIKRNRKRVALPMKLWNPWNQRRHFMRYSSL